MKSAPFAVAASLALGACASMGGDGSPAAPQPAKPVDPARFYTGAWHEIARNPMKITDGCVAGLTEFMPGPEGRIIDRDSCRKGSPKGEEKVFAGPVDIDPATPAKFTTHYKVFGPFGISRTYWILDHGDDYRWFITATPDFKNVSIFTRDPQISSDMRAMLVSRTQALGYDVSKLEYPAQPDR